MFFNIKKFNEKAIIPTKNSEDAGYDLYGCFEEEAIFLYPNDIYLVKLGIGIEIEKDKVFYITERSGSGSKGISTRSGVIDSGYRGEISTPLNNLSNKLIILSDLSKDEILEKYLDKIEEYFEKDFIIFSQKKAIAQGLLIQLAPHIDITQVKEFENNDTKRGEGGFGSTGK